MRLTLLLSLTLSAAAFAEAGIPYSFCADATCACGTTTCACGQACNPGASACLPAQAAFCTRDADCQGSCGDFICEQEVCTPGKRPPPDGGDASVDWPDTCGDAGVLTAEGDGGLVCREPSCDGGQCGPPHTCSVWNWTTDGGGWTCWDGPGDCVEGQFVDGHCVPYCAPSSGPTWDAGASGVVDAGEGACFPIYYVDAGQAGTVDAGRTQGAVTPTPHEGAGCTAVPVSPWGLLGVLLLGLRRRGEPHAERAR